MDVGARVGGRYVVRARLPETGRREVWTAADEWSGRPVVLTSVPAAGLAEPRRSDVRRTVGQEVRIAARLRSHHIVPVSDVTADDEGGLWVAGESSGSFTTVARLLRASGTPAPGQLARWGRDVAEGLAVLHEAGLVHRAVEPGLVGITDSGTAVLLAVAATGDLDDGGAPPEAGIDADVRALVTMLREQLAGWRGRDGLTEGVAELAAVLDRDPGRGTGAAGRLRDRLASAVVGQPTASWERPVDGDAQTATVTRSASADDGAGTGSATSATTGAPGTAPAGAGTDTGTGANGTGASGPGSGAVLGAAAAGAAAAGVAGVAAARSETGSGTSGAAPPDAATGGPAAAPGVPSDAPPPSTTPAAESPAAQSPADSSTPAAEPVSAAPAPSTTASSPAVPPGPAAADGPGASAPEPGARPAAEADRNGTGNPGFVPAPSHARTVTGVTLRQSPDAGALASPGAGPAGVASGDRPGTPGSSGGPGGSGPGSSGPGSSGPGGPGGSGPGSRPQNSGAPQNSTPPNSGAGAGGSPWSRSGPDANGPAGSGPSSSSPSSSGPGGSGPGTGYPGGMGAGQGAGGWTPPEDPRRRSSGGPAGPPPQGSPWPAAGQQWGGGAQHPGGYPGQQGYPGAYGPQQPPPGSPYPGYGVPPGPPPRRRRRGPWLAALAVVVALAVLVTAAIVFVRTRPVAEAPPPPPPGPVSAVGDPRTADPCRLLTEASLRPFGSTRLFADYGAPSGCAMILTSNGPGYLTVSTTISVQDPGYPPNGVATPVGPLTVYRETAEENLCSRTIALPDDNVVFINAQAWEGGKGNLCAIGDAATATSVAALSAGTLGRKTTTDPANALTSVDLCTAADASVVGRVSGVNTSRQVHGFAGWSCYWGYDTAFRYAPTVDVEVRRRAELSGTPVTIAGRRGQVEPSTTPGSVECTVSLVQRTFQEPDGSNRVEYLSIRVYAGSQGNPDSACRSAQTVAEAVTPRLPAPS